MMFVIGFFVGVATTVSVIALCQAGAVSSKYNEWLEMNEEKRQEREEKSREKRDNK